MQSQHSLPCWNGCGPCHRSEGNVTCTSHNTSTSINLCTGTSCYCLNKPIDVAASIQGITIPNIPGNHRPGCWAVTELHGAAGKNWGAISHGSSANIPKPFWKENLGAKPSRAGIAPGASEHWIPDRFGLEGTLKLPQSYSCHGQGQSSNREWELVTFTLLELKQQEKLKLFNLSWIPNQGYLQDGKDSKPAFYCNHNSELVKGGPHINTRSQRGDRLPNLCLS